MIKQINPSSRTDLWSELRERVDHYFTENNIKPTGNWKLYTKTIFLFSTLTTEYTILVFFTPQTWIAIVLCMLLGINLAEIGFNVMHDGGHGSYSTRTWVNKMMGYSLNLMGGIIYLWDKKHNVNHHSFTNIEGMDDDIDIKPWIRIHENDKKYWYHRGQQVYWVVLYGLTYMLWIFVQDFKKYFSGKIANTTFRKMNTREHIIFWVTKVVYVFTFFVIPKYVGGFEWYQICIGYVIMAFTCGMLIAIVFQLAHVVPKTSFPDKQGEWWLEQIATTADFATKSKVVTWFTGGLNYQIEHHLFPRISHVHYSKIHPIITDFCNEFGILFIEYPTVVSAISAHVIKLNTMGKTSALL